MNFLLKLVLMSAILFGFYMSKGSPLIKKLDYTEVIKDSTDNSYSHVLHYYYYSVGLGGMRGIYTETYNYDHNDVLLSIRTIQHKTSLFQIEDDHVMVDKITYFNTTGKKVESKILKRMSHSFQVMRDKVIYHKGLTRKVENHMKGYNAFSLIKF